MDPTAITTAFPDGPEGENWAEVATSAWIAAAAAEGVTADEVSLDWNDYDVDYGTLAGAVLVDGETLILTVDRRTDTVGVGGTASEMLSEDE